MKNKRATKSKAAIEQEPQSSDVDVARVLSDLTEATELVTKGDAVELAPKPKKKSRPHTSPVDGESQASVGHDTGARRGRPPSPTTLPVSKKVTWHDCDTLDKMDKLFRAMLVSPPTSKSKLLPLNIAPPRVTRRVHHSNSEVRNITCVTFSDLPPNLQKRAIKSSDSKSGYENVVERVSGNQVYGDTTVYFPQIKVWCLDGTGKKKEFTLGVQTERRSRLIEEMAKAGKTFSEIDQAQQKLPAGRQGNQIAFAAKDGTGKLALKNFKIMGSYWDPAVAGVAAAMSWDIVEDAGAVRGGAPKNTQGVPTEAMLKELLRKVEGEIQKFKPEER